MRILVVVNPIAGNRKHPVCYRELIAEVLGSKAEVEYLLWESATMDITHAVSEKINMEVFDCVMVMGGDGTVNRVAQALVGRNESLLIVPIGSGNGLARHLHIPMNIKKSIRLLLTGETVVIDTATINGLYFFCSAGVGFDAHIAFLFAQSNSRGLFTYIKMVLHSFFTYHSQRYKICYDGHTIEEDAFFVTVANANQWGNNVRVAPTSHISDGLLQLVVLKSFHWFSIPVLAIRLLNGTFHKSAKVQTYQAKSIKIERSSDDKEAHLDGEPLLLDNPLEIVINPVTLKIIIPQGFQDSI